jgi:hypothetical protein
MLPSMRWLPLIASLLTVGCGDSFTDGADGGAGGEGGSTGNGAGGKAVAGTNGCSDGTRDYDGLSDVGVFTRIAGCQGAWNQPGVATTPQCGRASGNDSTQPNGMGCSAADLCAPGWRICADAEAVADAIGGPCPIVTDSEIWITQQTTNSMKLCLNETRNNIVGCGNIGEPADSSCAPLDTLMLTTHCDMHPAWDCAMASDTEADNVTKSDPSSAGGVLCCLD